MGISTWLLMMITHPLEFRTLVQYAIYHEKKRDITSPKEYPTSGWDRPAMRRSWEFLDLTSRSFSSVIKELDDDLARVVCIFYLVLRALDTVEDDMTLASEVKQPLLRNWHKRSMEPGFNFSDSGPNEKDRQLLVEYQVVIEELRLLQPEYRDIILSITEKMGTGMADFVLRAEKEKEAGWLETIADYDLYCHYVAGLVGEGLSQLFSASGKEAPHLGTQIELSNSMGLLLQKTNITRDFREDVDDKRYFWPREIWAGEKYGGMFKSQDDMNPPLPFKKGMAWPAQDRALWVLSAMVLDGLRHATDALDYLRMLKNQSIFNFVAIPATMAIATLELCFMNPKLFAENIKIRKAVAAGLIMRSTNPREVSLIFREYARKIHAKALPRDPNFIGISVACGKIEAWCEHYYPSFVSITAMPSAATGTSSLSQAIDPNDARGRTFLLAEKADHERASKLRVEAMRAEIASGKRTAPPASDGAVWELVMYLGGGALVLLGVIGAVVYLIMQFSD